MPLDPGTTLGPYTILAPLGAGGMGEVYRARDSRLGREVAIKVLPEAFARDADRLARFRREAQALAALNHPHVAAIYGLEEQGAASCLVLELVEGETLAARLSRGPLALRELLELGVQVAGAIEAAHERGIVHRDLKPGNVMLAVAGVAKVLDFGLARHESEPGPDPAGDPAEAATLAMPTARTELGAVIGTAAYMSPEQARGRRVDRRSDVWSFGCLLFEALAGRAAFAGDTSSDLVARILEREPDWSVLPAGTPARLRDLLKRCLRKSADERPRDIRDVRLELADLASGGARGAPAGESIAVLPFENQSGPDDEYFADGITDEILNALAQVEGLRVAARSSCFSFKGRREDPRTVGERLEVTTLLEGTVRRAGTRLRITAQLVNASDGYQMWSERYDRELTDVFALQDEIAAAIAGKLRGATAAAPPDRARRGTRSLEAYELFLRGRAQQLRRGGSVSRAIVCFEQAIALDPEYAEALAWLSDSYRLLATYGLVPADEMMPRARAAAERALAIDPALTEALATLADVALQYEHDPKRALSLWDRALELDPSHVRARCERALWMGGWGAMEPARACAELERAAADEPHNAWVAGMHVFLLGFAGRHESALREAERALAIDAESFIVRLTALHAQAWLGRYDAVLALGRDLLGDSGRNPWVLALLGWSHQRRGEAAEARAVHAELEARSRHQYVAPFWLAVTAAAAGEADAALGHLDRSIATRDPLLIVTPMQPHAAELVALPGVRKRLEVILGNGN